MRIVSLVPSLTETVCRLGLEGKVVGCTSFCTHPKTLRHTAVSVGGTKDADFEKIKALSPTHILINHEENVISLILRLKDMAKREGWQVVETYPVTVEDSIAMVETLGAELGVEDPALRWSAEARAELELCRRETRERKIRYAYFIWREPWMVAGNQTYIAEMLRCVGALNVVETSTAPQSRYPAIEPRDERIGEADLLLFSSEPYPFKNRHMDEFLNLSGRAVATRKIDGQLVSWFGTMTLDGLRYLRYFFNEVTNVSNERTYDPSV